MDNSQEKLNLQMFPIDFNSSFYHNIFSKVVSQVKYPKDSCRVSVVNRERSQKLKMEIKELYEFRFDYPENDDKTVGIEVYKVKEE